MPNKPITAPGARMEDYFPLTPNLKSPQSRHWFGGGWHPTKSSDEGTIWNVLNEDYFLGAEAIPENQNWGLRTGEVSGIIVVDVDTKHGPKAEETITAWGLPRNTYTVRSSSGGLHLYYRDPMAAVIRNKVRRDLCVDVRGEGGYVVAPGSYLDGTGSDGDDYEGTYEVVSNAPILELDLSQYIPADYWGSAPKREQPSGGGASQGSGKERPSGPGASQGASSILEGGRNDALMLQGVKLRKQGYPLRDLESCLRRENLERCVPPLAQPEVDRIAANVSRYETEEDALNLGALITTAGEFVQRDIQLPERVLGPIRAGTLTIVGGEGGMGKSWLMMALAGALHTGTPWLQWDCPSPVSCLYIDTELSPGVMVDRARYMAPGIPMINKQTARDAGIDRLNLLEPKHRKLVVDGTAPGGFVFLDNAYTSAVQTEEIGGSTSLFWEAQQSLAAELGDIGAGLVLCDHFGNTKNRLQGSINKSWNADLIMRLLKVDGIAEFEKRCDFGLSFSPEHGGKHRHGWEPKYMSPKHYTYTGGEWSGAATKVS